jgi:nuclear pore complex protein Nup107
MHSSRLLFELVIVREWLHDTAPTPPKPETATGYWKFTKYQLMQALRTGNRMQSDGLVREMDPDAASREDGRRLAADDSVCIN